MVAALTLSLAAALIVVPVTRTALGNAIDGFFGGLAPDHPVNGQPLRGSHVPAWLRADTTRALVVAGIGQDRLIAYRERGAYCFQYGPSVGECADGHEWAQELAQYPVVLRGPTGGVGHPVGALYGFTRGDVTQRALLTFVNRPPVEANARNGGFAIHTPTRAGNPANSSCETSEDRSSRPSAWPSASQRVGSQARPRVPKGALSEHLRRSVSRPGKDPRTG